MRCESFAAVAFLLFTSVAVCQNWTIGNDRIERTISFDPTSGLVTQGVTDLTTHTKFILPAKRHAPEFSFTCNGQTLNGTTFRLIKADQDSLPDGKSLTVRLQSKTVPLEVLVVYRVYNGHPAIRKWLVLKNAGSTPLQFSHLNIEAIAPAVGL